MPCDLVHLNSLNSTAHHSTRTDFLLVFYLNKIIITSINNKLNKINTLLQDSREVVKIKDAK